MVDAAIKKEFVPSQLIKQHDKLRIMLTNQKNESKLKSLYDHIIDVLDFIVVNYPNEALLKFEEVSYLLKSGDTKKLHKFLSTEVQRQYARNDARVAKETARFVAFSNQLFATGTATGAEGEEAEAATNAPVGFIPDLIADNRNIY